MSCIASTITFMGAAPEDGVVDWHADGIPSPRSIPLQITDDARGSELQVFRGHYETGMARLARGQGFADHELAKFPHRLGHATLAQLIRVLHSTAAMPTGSRISLSIRELRVGLAATLARAAEAPRCGGAHRRAEVVLMSVEQYEALVRAARRREAVAEALASVRAEGLEPTLDGLEQLERLAAGEIAEDDAVEALRRRHQR